MYEQEIESALLAQDPYLWIGDVVSISDSQIHTRKYLDPSLPIFEAHYKGFPLFPGALQCEAAFQASAALIARTIPVKEGHVPVIARVRNVKFRRLVQPGETLDIVVETKEVIGSAIHLRGRISVDGQTTTELTFTATEAPLPGNQDE